MVVNEETDFVIVLKASLEAVLVMVVIAGVGTLLKKKGVINDNVADSLTSLLTYVCVPSMSFLAIAPTVNLSYLSQLWLIPVYTALNIFFGLFIGAIAGHLLKTRPSITVLLMVMTAFPNSTALPLAMLQSLQQNLGLLGESEWLDLSVGKSTVLFVSAMMIICRWTLGYYILDPKRSWNQLQPGSLSPNRDDQEAEMTEMSTWYNKPLLSTLVDIDEFEDNEPFYDAEATYPLEDFGGEEEGQEEQEEQEEQEQEQEHQETDQQQTQNQPNPPLTSPPRRSSLSPSRLSSPRLSRTPSPFHGEEEERERERRLEEGLTSLWERTKVIPAPIVAIFVAVVVGVIPPLKTLFFPTESDAASVGESWGITFFPQYLAFTIVETMDPFSEMTIPLGLLLIGSSVIDGLSSVESLGLRVIFVACLCRLVIMPVISCILVFILVQVGLPNQPVVLLSVLLSSAMPPETNLIVLVSLHHVLLSEFATLMVFNYLAFMLSTPAITLLFTWVIESLSEPDTSLVRSLPFPIPPSPSPLLMNATDCVC